MYKVGDEVFVKARVIDVDMLENDKYRYNVKLIGTSYEETDWVFVGRSNEQTCILTDSVKNEMSMTESEVIEKLRKEAKNKRADADWKWRHGRLNADDLIHSAENMEQIAKWIEEVQQLHAIGTVSEFRELKEKATVKKAIVSRSKHEAYCPNCKSVVADDEFWALDEYLHHCNECGQAILGTDWSEGKE